MEKFVVALMLSDNAPNFFCPLDETKKGIERKQVEIAYSHMKNVRIFGWFDFGLATNSTFSIGYWLGLAYPSFV